MDPFVYESRGSVNGELGGTVGTVSLASDGSSFTAVTTGTNEQGEAVNNSLLWERQR